MIKLILVRHVLTEENLYKKLSGHLDSKISNKGIWQIKYLTNFLKERDIDKIYTSTSSRTKESVKEIAKIKNLEIIEVEELKEINFGKFEGLSFKDIKKNYPDEFEMIVKEGATYKYPNGESSIDAYNRVSKSIDDIIKCNEGNTVVVCSHGGSIRNIITHLICGSYELHWNFKIDNASVSIIEITDNFAVISSLNDTSFLNRI